MGSPAETPEVAEQSDDEAEEQETSEQLDAAEKPLIGGAPKLAASKSSNSANKDKKPRKNNASKKID